MPVQGRKGRMQDWGGEPQMATWVRGHLGWSGGELQSKDFPQRSSVWELNGPASALRWCSLISWGLSSTSMASALELGPSGRCCGWRLAVSSPHPWQLPRTLFLEGGTEWHRSTSVSDG